VVRKPQTGDSPGVPAPGHEVDRLALRPDIEEREEFGQGHAQSRCDPPDVDERRVALAPLDSADVCVVEAGPVRELLLGEAARLPQPADPLPEQRP
jgi:hypothetical protein